MLPNDVRSFVRAAIDAAGIPASDAEFEEMVAAYPDIRRNTDRLYIDEARYEDPALVFRPTPRARKRMS